jgi:hypothetical protein
MSWEVKILLSTQLWFCKWEMQKIYVFYDISKAFITHFTRKRVWAPSERKSHFLFLIKPKLILPFLPLTCGKCDDMIKLKGKIMESTKLFNGFLFCVYDIIKKQANKQKVSSSRNFTFLSLLTWKSFWHKNNLTLLIKYYI